MATTLVHHSPYAGSWYPADAVELKNLLAGAFRSSEHRTGPFVRKGGVAFIVPHAAPVYSGVVAAAAYRHLQATGAERVVILGFPHRHALDGVAIPDVDGIETPLGTVRVDRALAAELATPPFQVLRGDPVCDHSVEIQLPLLQTVLPEAAIVPLYVGRLTEEEQSTAARRLASIVDRRTALVASSDLTHYGRDFGYQPFPVDDETPAKIRRLDMSALAAAGSTDHGMFGAELDQSGATVCGRAPIRLLLETLRTLGTEVFQEVLDYDTSGTMVKSFRHSVSYGATGYFPASAFHLDAATQAALLRLARESLDAYRVRGEYQPLRSGEGSPELRQHGRVFVSLQGPATIRGCVGCFDSPRSFTESVPSLTCAACEDQRWGAAPVDEPLEIELHILTPPRRISDPGMLRAGEHGGYLVSHEHRGLLLPVVATKYGLSREEFLRELARKAGVSPNVYSSGTAELSVFRDQVVREKPATPP